MKRNSRLGFEFRELLAGVKQLRRTVELASERLPQILMEKDGKMFNTMFGFVYFINLLSYKLLGK